MVVIGLVGGIASGKSMVSQQLQALGATRLDADAAGHQVLLEPAVKQAVRERWGEQVFSASGEIVRQQVAGIVFAPAPGGPVELAFLENLTHPRIARILQQQLDDFQGGVLVLDAPVMFKAGWNRFCDHIIFVDTPYQQRLERAQQRGWTESQFAAREAAQESIEWKRQQASFIVDNSSTPEAARRQVADIWATIARAAPQARAGAAAAGRLPGCDTSTADPAP